MTDPLDKLRRKQRINQLMVVLYTFAFTGLSIVWVLSTMVLFIFCYQIFESQNLKLISTVLGATLVSVVSGVLCYILYPRVLTTQDKDKTFASTIETIKDKKEIQAGAMSLAADQSSAGGLTEAAETGQITSHESSKP